MNPRFRWLLATLSVLVLLAGSFWLVRGGGSDSTPASNSLNDGPPIREFALTTQAGEEFHSSSLQGQVWVASYFFTRCGSNCRELNTRLARLQREYGPQGVQFVSISCDPTYDVPVQLKQYANLMSANQHYWTFLTGDLEYVQRVGRDVIGQPVSEKGHNAMITIFDRSGEARGVYDALDGLDLERAVEMIEALVGEASNAKSEVESENGQS